MTAKPCDVVDEDLVRTALFTSSSISTGSRAEETVLASTSYDVVAGTIEPLRLLPPLPPELAEGDDPEDRDEDIIETVLIDRKHLGGVTTVGATFETAAPSDLQPTVLYTAHPASLTTVLATFTAVTTLQTRGFQPDELIGTEVAGARIEAFVRRGTTWDIYLARLGRARVVAKVLRDPSRYDEVLAALELRARTTSALLPRVHRIAAIADRGERRLVFVVEHVPGKTLAELGRISWDLTAGIAAKLLDGLSALHRGGVAGLDLASTSIVVRADGQPCLAGDGIHAERGRQHDARAVGNLLQALLADRGQDAPVALRRVIDQLAYASATTPQLTRCTAALRSFAAAAPSPRYSGVTWLVASIAAAAALAVGIACTGV